ncbi:MAG: hypothetical protein IMW89_05365 [Ktedonobacteraceae bacterium]|nr:hypothetical protein [Ktedonobacteraceae bacterium]
MAMATPAIWSKEHISYPTPFDTIFFDVDGILIETTHSFRATDIAVAEYVVGTLHGLDWGQRAGRPLFTQQDVDAFKQAGGYNNDWDMCYLLASLGTARLREWRGTPLAGRSIREWAALSREANLRERGGRAWVEEVIPASALIDYAVVGDIYREIYWGASELKKRYGREARFLPDAPGLFHLETMLYAPDFPRHLREAGIRHLGMITGRVGPEVTLALERMEAYSGERWWDIVIPADLCAKPDPRALRLAINAVGARGGLYIGDTADDHDLVRNYLAERSDGEPDFLVAVSVSEQEFELYRQREPDFIVRSVEDLLLLLPGSLDRSE